jgi:hypothetical protein
LRDFRTPNKKGVLDKQSHDGICVALFCPIGLGLLADCGARFLIAAMVFGGTAIMLRCYLLPDCSRKSCMDLSDDTPHHREVHEAQTIDPLVQQNARSLIKVFEVFIFVQETEPPT